MKRMLLVLALVVVMAGVAAPTALARPQPYCYTNDPELSVYNCHPTQKACEQVQANDPAALSECIKLDKLLRG
jgi:hypothetical protein